MRTNTSYYTRLYYQKASDSLFKEAAQNTATGNPNYIDLWNDVPMYGKVSPEGTLMIPNEDQMKYALGISSVAALPWMYEAVTDLQSYFSRASVQGRTALGDLFNNFIVAKSYESPYDDYFAHTTKVMLTFNKRIASRTHGLITNFDNYLKEFIRYLANLENPITFASYFASSRVSSFSTGLLISFDEKDANNDRLKNKYFESDEFRKYVQGAANFGFRVDQNAPWRLIADLASKPMETYFIRHNIANISDAFSTYYIRAVDYERLSIMKILFNGYTDYQGRREYGVTTKYCIRPPHHFKVAMHTDVLSAKELTYTIDDLTEQSFAEKYDEIGTWRLLEVLKKAETRKLDQRAYRNFKRRFEMFLKKGSWIEASRLLTSFYNGY